MRHRHRGRKIVVDDVSYRWAFGAGFGDEDYVGLFIWCEGVREPGIAVRVRLRDFWLDISDDNRQLDPDDYRQIKPSLVRELVLWAQQWGWQPGQSPGQMVFQYDWKTFTVYKAVVKG